jgi:hypothetical protein
MLQERVTPDSSLQELFVMGTAGLNPYSDPFLLSKCNGRRCDSLCRSNTGFKDRVLFHFAQTPVPCEQKSAADDD